MRGSRAEVMVGAFAIAVIVILTLITFKVGDITFGKKRGYRLYAYFRNTAGLGEQTKVKIAGVDAGVVEKIELVEGKAKVTLRIDPDVNIYSDGSTYIRATGLLGDKYLEIDAGSIKPRLEPGDTIRVSHEIVDMDEVINNISAVSMNIMDLIADLNTPEIKKALKDTIMNLQSITDNLNRVVVQNRDEMDRIFRRVDSLVATLDELATANKGAFTNTMGNMEELSASLKKDVPALVENLSDASIELRDLMQKSGPKIADITNSVNSIAGKIDRGEGTIGKLVNDERLYDSLSGAAGGFSNTIASIERLRTFLTFRGDYLDKIEEGKGQFLLTLQPREDKYYILGIVSDPIGKVTVTETTVDGVTVREEKTEEKLEFTAQFAKRFWDTALRIGITESTFGLGADQFLFNDRLIVSADAWDFSDDEAGADHPHIRLGADLFVFKSLFLSGGADNLLNKNRRGAYVGAGVKFEDTDFKYLFGSVPRVPGQ